MVIAELTLKSDAESRVIPMLEGGAFFVGRDSECDLHLSSRSVSRRHALILTLRGQCGLKDLDSANGTLLNGKRIVSPMRLKDGDVIQIADFVMVFNTVAEKTAVGFTPRECTPNPGDDIMPLVLGSAVDAVEKPAKKSSPDPFSTDRDAAPDLDALARQADSDTTEPAEDEPELPNVSPGATDIMSASEVAEEMEKSEEPEEQEEQEESGEPEEAEEADINFNALLEETLVSEPEPEPEQPRRKLDADTVRIALESILKTPKAPQAPKVEVEDIETGDGSADAEFTEGEEAQETVDPELALARAAAEAGLVGEFTPEPEATPAPAPVPASAVPVAMDAAVVPDAREPNPNAIPIDDEFRAAIESRLFLYSFLADLKEERNELRAAYPAMLDAVKSELSRQDREMDKLPPPEKAEDMIAKRTQKRRDLKAKIKEAKANGTPMPPLPSKAMRQAEDIAINQWTLIAQSGREALPGAYEAGYKLMRLEPLTGELETAGVDAKTLLGGAAYLLALGELLEESKYNRSVTKARLSSMQPTTEKKGGKGLLGFFGKGGDDDDEDDEDEEETLPAESYEELVEMEEQLGRRVSWINQEMAAVELALIKEFWAVYTRTAVHYLVGHLEIPTAVRVFLRFGAVGFNRWWMTDEVRDHVIESCSKDVLERLSPSGKATHVVYADEYLAAVMNGDCTPAMDENLEMNCRNSPEWKADKALRKLIYSRSQTTLMRELVGSLAGRVEDLEQKAVVLDERLKNLLPGSRNYKPLKSDLSMQRQSLRVEIAKLNKLAEKIKTTTLAELHEAIEETEQRFESGELPRPTPTFLVERECEGVRKIGRLLANLKERFLPLVMRDSFHPFTDACNDRGSILGEFNDIERRDPGIFLETIIDSKKRANRVDLRLSPVIVLVPSAGLLAFSWNPRQKPEDGRLGIPTCFIRPRLRERQMTYLLSDFRWDTSKASAGMDVMNSETIVAAFMSVRWDWRKRSREAREKGLVYTDQNDRTNWRRVYEAYMQTAYDGGKKLYNRNYDFYERIIGKYFDMPEDVQLLRK